MRESNLTFEGFLEALCRISVLKALPTDEEITAAGAADAHEYLAQLKLNDEEGYKTLLRERRTAWGVDPSQPTWRCVAHLCAIIVRTMEEASAGADNLMLTEQEVAGWIRGHMKSP